MSIYAHGWHGIQAWALTVDLYMLRKYVGIAEGIFGIFCAAAGIPAGWIADRMRRDRTLRLCGFVMLGLLLQDPLSLQQIPPHLVLPTYSTCFRTQKHWSVSCSSVTVLFPAIAAAIAATSAALFLPPHEVTWRGQVLDVRYIVLLGAMVSFRPHRVPASFDVKPIRCTAYDKLHVIACRYCGGWRRGEHQLTSAEHAC